jgi:spore coat polysaccharide biosynthesis predicted glycosyltransferase SpsG
MNKSNQFIIALSLLVSLNAVAFNTEKANDNHFLKYFPLDLSNSITEKQDQIETIKKMLVTFDSYIFSPELIEAIKKIEGVTKVTLEDEDYDGYNYNFFVTITYKSSAYNAIKAFLNSLN